VDRGVTLLNQVTTVHVAIRSGELGLRVAGIWEGLFGEVEAGSLVPIHLGRGYIGRVVGVLQDLVHSHVISLV
jgi:hypothetical protein